MCKSQHLIYIFNCIVRVNCGTKEVLEQFGYTPPPIHVEPYNIPLGHNVMPREFRWKLWALCIGNCLATLAYEKLFVLGFVHKYLANRFPVDRLKKTL